MVTGFNITLKDLQKRLNLKYVGGLASGLASLASALHCRLLSWIEQFVNTQLKLSEAVYGLENQISLLYYPGIGTSDDGGEFGRLLQNTTCEAFHWLAGTSLITWEEAEARKERLKVFYPRAALNRSERMVTNLALHINRMSPISGHS